MRLIESHKIFSNFPTFGVNVGEHSIPQNIVMDLNNVMRVVNFWFFLIKSEVYSIDTSKMISDFPEVSNFNLWFLKLSGFVCNIASKSGRSGLHFISNFVFVPCVLEEQYKC